MINIRDVSKRFDDCQALDHLSLHVEPGSVYGLVGPNGAGKSTIIQHITGTYKQDSGEVLVDGQPVFENVPLKDRIACIPTTFYYYPSATINDMARFYDTLRPSFDKQRFAQLGAAFNLDPDRPIRKFSKGMVKQTAFWLALAQRPDVLLLDEPMDGLDPLMRRQAWSLVMGDVADRGMTVLVSSHNLRELEGVCDHMGIMSRGHMQREYDLTTPGDGVVKVQMALPDGVQLPDDLQIAFRSDEGRLMTLIIRGDVAAIRSRLEALHPVILEVLPLTLEELFLYEMGGAADDIRELVL